MKHWAKQVAVRQLCNVNECFENSLIISIVIETSSMANIYSNFNSISSLYGAKNPEKNSANFLRIFHSHKFHWKFSAEFPPYLRKIGRFAGIAAMTRVTIQTINTRWWGNVFRGNRMLRAQHRNASACKKSSSPLCKESEERLYQLFTIGPIWDCFSSRMANFPENSLFHITIAWPKSKKVYLMNWPEEFNFHLTAMLSLALPECSNSCSSFAECFYDSSFSFSLVKWFRRFSFTSFASLTSFSWGFFFASFIINFLFSAHFCLLRLPAFALYTLQSNEHSLLSARYKLKLHDQKPTMSPKMKFFSPFAAVFAAGASMMPLNSILLMTLHHIWLCTLYYSLLAAIFFYPLLRASALF